MADTAFDPNLPPEYQVAPPPPSAAPTPAPPQGGGEPAPSPAPGALAPVPPPALTPGVPSQQPGQQQAPDDVQDETDFTDAARLDSQRYTQLVDHRRGLPIVPKDQVDPEQDPRIVQLGELRQLIPKMAPGEQRTALQQWNAENNRIRREITQANTQATRADEARHREELKGIDAPFENLTTRAQQAAYINNDVINPLRLKYTQGVDPDAVDPNKRQLDLGNPQVKQELDYFNKTTPLSTMGQRQFRDTVTSIAMRNPGMSPEAAAAYALSIGAPTDLRPGRGGQSFNGQKGAGGANYRVRGSDYNGVALVEMMDGNIIRVDPTSFNELARARRTGYKAAKQYLRDLQTARDEASKPNMIERAGKAIYDTAAPMFR